MLMAPALFVTGCSKDDDDEITPQIPQTEYVYVLNEGTWNGNNSTLTLYDVEKGEVYGKDGNYDFFEITNGRKLGDTGQDIIIYGSKMYIAMSGESTVEVTDLDAKSIKPINTEGEPRYFAVKDGKVYVTYFNGYVARIDTATLEVESKVQVGRNPEQMTIVGNRLYVANSGGLDAVNDNTVSVVDLASFTETKKIEVIVNPVGVSSDKNGNVFVVSNGNYYDILNTVQRINTATDEVSVLFNGTVIATIDNVLYTIYSQWGVPEVEYKSYNTAENRIVSDNFIGETAISNPYKLCAADDCLFLTTSDFVTNGDVFVFDNTNRLLYSFEVGLGPAKAVRVLK
jgi:YVTN family beta-propeller protein